MKKHSLLVEIVIFSLVFLFCALPPLFFSAANTEQGHFFEWRFPAAQGIRLLGAVALLFLCRAYNLISLPQKSQMPHRFFLEILFPAFFTLCLLFCSGLFFKFLSVFIKNPAVFSGKNVSLPQSFLEWIFCILNFFSSAFYEEIIYRLYLPDAIKKFAIRLSQKKIISVAAEAFVCLLFALAHLYAGWLSVINAAIAHLILRICYQKSKGIIAPGAAHFIYNLLALLFL